ncbi:MAG: ImmA/IrrE family metallo-endopeptidase [Deferrisomatales bacterium]
MTQAVQLSLFDDPVGPEPEADAARRALDELFAFARAYRSGESYRELLEFVSRFRFYAPFNALLVHVQMPGATFVAPAHRWWRDYGRRILRGARPLIILQPMGPVMFVFDVADTEPEADAPPLPPEVVRPFEVRRGRVQGELDRTIENAKRDGVAVTTQAVGSQRAGSIGAVPAGRHLFAPKRLKPEPEHVKLPLRYEVCLSSTLSAEARYATLVHELAHLYCGHLGTPDDRWWPDRRRLDRRAREFEAESVCYLVCRRLGLEPPSDEYLSGYLKATGDVPEISLECVVKAAGLIEQMGAGALKLRPEPRP